MRRPGIAAPRPGPRMPGPGLEADWHPPAAGDPGNKAWRLPRPARARARGRRARLARDAASGAQALRAIRVGRDWPGVREARVALAAALHAGRERGRARNRAQSTRGSTG